MSIFIISTIKVEIGNLSCASIYAAIKAGIFTKPVPSRECSVDCLGYEGKAINQARIADQIDEQIKKLVNSLYIKQIIVANGVRD